MSEFDRLIKEIEDETHHLGWCWLVRSTQPSDGYFANIYTTGKMNFPVYDKTPYLALCQALKNFRAYRKEQPDAPTP